jgi:hypothetical protein
MPFLAEQGDIMEWEFTSADVVRGEVGYGLPEFRRDLGEEVRANLPGLDDPELDRLFRMVYDLHYWLATGNEYGEFEDQYADQPQLLPLLRAVHAQCTANVEMLGAILQRLIMDGIEAGAPLEQALDQAARTHRNVVAIPISDLPAPASRTA